MPSDWPDKRATVRFKDDNLIDPLTLQLCRWEDKKGSPLKPPSELSLRIGARVELDGKSGKGRGQVMSHSGKGWWYVLLEGDSITKSARTPELKVLPDSEEEGQEP